MVVDPIFMLVVRDLPFLSCFPMNIYILYSKLKLIIRAIEQC